MRSQIARRLIVSSLFLLASTTVSAQQTVGAANAAAVVGKGATVCGKVESAKFNENSEGQPTFLHFGGAFPKHTFSLRINGVDRGKFSPAPDALVGRMVCATGNVVFAQGNLPEMVISNPAELNVM